MKRGTTKRMMNDDMRIKRYPIGTQVYIQPLIGLGLKATIEINAMYPEGLCYHGDDGKYYDDTDLWAVHVARGW